MYDVKKTEKKIQLLIVAIMIIGVLKENSNENRVSLLPDNIKKLTDNKVTLYIEHEAGVRAGMSDDNYKEAGAQIVGREKVIKESDILLSITLPDQKELSSLKKEAIVISLINPLQNQKVVDNLLQLNLTSFSLDLVPRTTRAQSMDVLSSMATVAGYKAVLEAANLLSNFFPMFMSAAGTIKPAKVLVLGAGVAGLQAIATARKLGAVVEAFDVRSAVKEEVQSLGGKFIEVEGAIDDDSAGGYAVEQSEDYKKMQQQLIQDHAMKANVVISTAQIPGRKAPLLIKKETVEQMPKGSVIVDLAASTGGNCEVTKNDEIIQYKGVTIVGKSNYPSEIPIDASKMFGNNLINFLQLLIDKDGNLSVDFDDDIVSGTCLTHMGKIMNTRVKKIIQKD